MKPNDNFSSLDGIEIKNTITSNLNKTQLIKKIEIDSLITELIFGQVLQPHPP